MWTFTVLASLLLCVNRIAGQRALESYNIDRTRVSTSGISSGACMATQFHVAYSDLIMGAGMVAGAPYYCAKGSSAIAVNACMNSPNQINVADLVAQTNRYDATNDIDSTANLSNDRVFILGGTLDTTVDQGVALKAEEYYRSFMPAANIKTVYNLAMNHGFPTVNYGVACASAASPYINRCNYDGAYEILNHMYGGLQKPSGSVPLPGDFYMFDQTEFFYISPPAASSMDTVGYVYVPSACVNRATVCRLHVVFHGCLQGRHAIGDEFARNTGYNEVGQLNNIIMLYPQAQTAVGNPNGCWDWWGYTIPAYATKGANQPLAVFRMVEKAML